MTGTIYIYMYIYMHIRDKGVSGQLRSVCLGTELSENKSCRWLVVFCVWNISDELRVISGETWRNVSGEVPEMLQFLLKSELK